MTQAGLCSNCSCGKLREVSSRNILIPEEDSPDKLTLVLEPEAAAFFCQNMSKREYAQYCTAEGPFKCDNYLVVDVGGGTVDIVAYQLQENPEPHMVVLREPSGGPWGGAVVNAEFKKFLSEITGDQDFSNYLHTGSEETDISHRAALDEIFYESFETQKTLFGSNKINKRGKASVKLNSSFIRLYSAEIKVQVEKVKANEGKTCTSFSSETGELRVTYTKLEVLFNPIVNEIIQCITEVLKNVPKVQTIFLVGGFGGCEYIHLQLKNYFKDEYKFITPRHKEYAVVRGAAMMRKNPEFIKARRADATYGVGVRIPFVPEIHDEKYRRKVEGKADMCCDIFSAFIEKGDIVSPEYMYMKTFYPERENQDFMRVHIYSSSEKDVWYVTGKRPSSNSGKSAVWCNVEKIGELLVPFHKTGEEDSDTDDCAIDVMFDFNTAEIIVTGRHHGSKDTFRMVLDFLGT
jgi:hypothetical protein